ncbi:MAG: hypothetical protein ABI639_15400 [Thermoanaerobaculia bacterium]
MEIRNPLDFALCPIDDDRRLFISPAIRDWSHLEPAGVRVVIDLEGEIDRGVPILPNHTLYLYFPIFDEELPDLDRLNGIAVLGARLVRSGQPVLSHCGAGFNRSALLAGLILVELGWSGADALKRLRERRPGALFNDVFAAYLASR